MNDEIEDDFSVCVCVTGPKSAHKRDQTIQNRAAEVAFHFFFITLPVGVQL
jgi:hypothetical protein